MTHVDPTAIISAVGSALTVSLLTVVTRAITGLRHDTRRFMREHLYLLRVADWSKVNLANLFDHLSLTPTEPPPILPKDEVR